MIRTLRAMLAVVCAAFLAAPQAMAAEVDTYPSQPVKILVGFSAAKAFTRPTTRRCSSSPICCASFPQSR